VGPVIGPLLCAALLYAFFAVIGVSAPQYFELLYGLLIVLLVLFLPNGLMSLLIRRNVDVL
jgi:branched-chain amino acid transport system permease protein